MILQHRQRQGDHVFREFNWYRGKLALDAALKGIAPWRLHDLRRTAAKADCIPDGMTIPELAEQVVRGKIKLSPAQQRMLIELLPFYMPKLSAVGYLHEGDTFASRLERHWSQQQRPPI